MARKRDEEMADPVPGLKIQLRVGGGVIGPGKIQLLECLDAEGGITAAAKAMDLSYRRAWYLIDTLNAALGQPVVETKVGGEGGGGAKLTPFGRELVARYYRALRTVNDAADPLLGWLGEITGETAETD